MSNPSAPRSKSKSPVDDPNQATIWVQTVDDNLMYDDYDEKTFIRDFGYVSKKHLDFSPQNKHESLLYLVKMLIAERIDALHKWALDEDAQRSVILTYDNDVSFYNSSTDGLLCITPNKKMHLTVDFSDEDICGRF
jgi:hypothetical protein